MASLTFEELKDIAGNLYDLAEHLFNAGHDIPPAVYGLKVKDGKLAGVDRHMFEGSARTALPRLVQKLQQKYSVVATMFTAWSAPADLRYDVSNHPERKEIVSIMIYANGKAYDMACKIKRDEPKRLIRGELRQAQSISGAMAPGGHAEWTSEQVTQRAKELKKILKERAVSWKTATSMRLLEFRTLAPTLMPLMDVIMSNDIPTEAAEFASAALERSISVFQADEVGTGRVGWLAGIRLRFWPTSDDTIPDIEDIKGTIAEILPQSVAKTDLPIYFPPNSCIVAVDDYIPPEFVRRLSELSPDWIGRDPEFADKATLEWFQKRNQKGWTEFLGDPLKGESVEIVVVALLLDEPEQAVAAFNAEETSRWTIALEGRSACLEQAAADIGEALAIRVKFCGIDPLFQALHAVRVRRVCEHYSNVLDIATGGDDSAATSTDVQIFCVHAEEPTPHTRTMVGISIKDGTRFVPRSMQHQPWEVHPTFAMRIAEALQSKGVRSIRVQPEVIRTRAIPHDEFGVRMFPDGHGGWFSQAVAEYPEARGVVQRLPWEYVNRECIDDQVVDALPLPHRLVRSGLVEMVQRHYTPRMYRAIKEVLGDPNVPDGVVWNHLSDRDPSFRELYTKHPDIAIPDVLTWSSLRMHWVNAPTLKVRSTLLERLALTDIDTHLPANFLRSPFPLAYIHYESPLEHAGVKWSAKEGDAQTLFSLEGAFVKEQQVSQTREFTLVMVWRHQSEVRKNLSTQITLQIADEKCSIEHYINEHYQKLGLQADDIEADAPAIAEILKVLIYMGLKDARMQKRTERSDALKGLPKKKRETQIKELQRARGLYDHILVGPEPAAEEHQVVGEGFAKNTMPVHHRRGHFHTYRVGPGRQATEIKFIAPIIVNKHLLTADDSIPSPKDYRLH